MRSRVVMVLMGVLASVPLRVAAQAGEVEQGLRLGLETDLVAHTEHTLALPGDASFLARRNTTRTTSYGLAVPRVGIDLGFALPFMVLGVRASVVGSESSSESVASGLTDDSFSNALQYRVLAYGEGRFVLASPLALQVRGELGVIGGEQWLGDPDSGSSATHVGVTLFSVGARIGLHIHPVGPFSISPYVGLAGLFGGGNTGEVSDRTPRSGSVEGYEVSFGVALFGWIPIGAATAGPADDHTEEEEEPSARPTVATSSAEPTHSGDNWSVAFDVPGAEARAWSNASTGAVQIELRTSSDTARFTDCTEALLASATARETVAVRVTTNRTLTGIDEQLVMFGTQRHLEVLQADGGRLEICGYTIELPGASRYALGRLLTRSRVTAPPPAPPPPPAVEPSPLVPVPEEAVAPASPDAAPPQ
jgi:hypothetical protein